MGRLGWALSKAADHGLINYIDTKAKKLTCKGTLRQVFIKVHRLEVQSVLLAFFTQVFELLPLQPSLYFNTPHSLLLLCMNK